MNNKFRKRQWIKFGVVCALGSAAYVRRDERDSAAWALGAAVAAAFPLFGPDEEKGARSVSRAASIPMKADASTLVNSIHHNREIIKELERRLEACCSDKAGAVPEPSTSHGSGQSDASNGGSSAPKGTDSSESTPDGAELSDAGSNDGIAGGSGPDGGPTGIDTPEPPPVRVKRAYRSTYVANMHGDHALRVRLLQGDVPVEEAIMNSALVRVRDGRERAGGTVVGNLNSGKDLYGFTAKAYHSPVFSVLLPARLKVEGTDPIYEIDPDHIALARKYGADRTDVFIDVAGKTVIRSLLPWSATQDGSEDFEHALTEGFRIEAVSNYHDFEMPGVYAIQYKEIAGEPKLFAFTKPGEDSTDEGFLETAS